MAELPPELREVAERVREALTKEKKEGGELERIKELWEKLKPPRKKSEKILDTKTGIVYSDWRAAGRMVAREYSLDPKDPYVYYKIIRIDPKRFTPFV